MLLAIGLAAATRSDADWTPVGPPGGDARSLAFDPRNPQTVYLGTADGVLYRSDDAGDRWQRLEPGFPRRGQSLDEIAVDAQGRVLVAFWEVNGQGGGVARSADGGRTFTLLPGIDGESVRALAIDGKRPGTLFAGTLSGVFRSDDDGAHWQRISPAAPTELRNVESLALDPRDPLVLYAGTWHLPWKTTDGGKTWHPAKLGMIEDSDVFTLSLDHRRAEVVYGTACSGIYRSTDAAGHWTKVRGIPPSSRRTRAFVQDPAHTDVFVAGTTEGLWRSDDDLKSWRLVTPKELVVNALVVLPTGRILAGADGAGVWRSDDGGATWAASNDGFSERFVGRVIFDPDHDRVLAAIREDRQHGGVLAARWPGSSWTALAPGLEGREVLALAVLGENVFAGTDDGLYRLNEKQALWQRLTVAEAAADVDIRVTDLATVAPATVLATTASGLLRTDDGGATWTRVRMGLAGTVETVAADAYGRAFATTPDGLFASSDRGAHFTAAAAVPAAVRRLVATETDLLAATSDGLFRCRLDAVASGPWQRVRGLPAMDIAAFDVVAGGQTLLASDFREGGVFRSDDGGETWRTIAASGLRSNRLWTIAADPRAPERVLAASISGGLHRLEVASGSPNVAAR